MMNPFRQVITKLNIFGAKKTNSPERNDELDGGFVLVPDTVAYREVPASDIIDALVSLIVLFDLIAELRAFGHCIERDLQDQLTEREQSYAMTLALWYPEETHAREWTSAVRLQAKEREFCNPGVGMLMSRTLFLRNFLSRASLQKLMAKWPAPLHHPAPN